MTDIIQVSFINTHRENLDTIENELISAFELGGIPLRNIALTSIPKGETDLQKIFPKADQDKWLLDNSSQPKVFQRKVFESHRKKYERKFRMLHMNVAFEEMVSFLRVYFMYLVPEPYLTAMDFWRISCMPQKNKDIEVLCRVNIYMQEVLTVYIDGDKLYYSMHLTKTELTLNALKRLSYITKGIVISDHKYKTGGADQLHVNITGTERAIQFIKANSQAIKTFNLRLMNKGVGFNKLSHCVELASYVLPTKAEKNSGHL